MARKGEMTKTHTYRIGLEWIGNTGTGTSQYRGYLRDHVVRAGDKPDLSGSSDPAFRGDRARWNPEELLVATLSACHQLSYLHQAAVAGVVVTAYTDDASGEMVEDDHDGGRFRSVVLRPTVTVTAPSMVDTAQKIHAIAHEKCFIASSVAFPVEHRPTVLVENRRPVDVETNS